MKRGQASWLIAAMLAMPAAAVAQDDESPDLAFLEYLGSWQDSDEEWLVVAEQMAETATDEDNDAPAADADRQAAARRDDANDDEQNSD